MKQTKIPSNRSRLFAVRHDGHALGAALLGAALTAPAIAQSDPPPSQILIKNVQVFAGEGVDLSAATDVLITANKIEKISTEAGNGVSTKVQIIDGGGRVLVPGLIESHAHLGFARLPLADLLTSLPGCG